MNRTPSAHPRRKMVPARGIGQRMELTLPPADVEAIRTVAALTGESTFTAVLRNALKAYTWLVIEQQRNRRIVSEGPERDDRVQLMPLLCVTELSASRRPSHDTSVSPQS